MCAPAERCLAVTPLGTGKSEVREGRMDTPSFANACGQVGAEPPAACGGRSPLQCHSSPQACAHSPSRAHTRPGARSGGRRARQPRSVVQSARPTPPVAPRRRATPPTLHPGKAIGRRGGAARRELAARADDPPRLRFALRKPPTPERSRQAGGGGCPSLCPWRLALRACGAGSGKLRVGKPWWGGGRRRAHGYLLVPRAGVEAAAALGGVAAGDTLGCLEGAAGGGSRAEVALPQTCASGVTSCRRSHPGRTPLLFSLHFSLRCPPAPGAPARAPAARSEEAGASHEPFVLGPFSTSAARLPLLLPAGSGGCAWRPGKRVERGAAAPEESGVANTWQLLEAGAPGVPGPSGYRCAGPQTRSAHPSPHLLPPETTQELVVGRQSPKEPSGLRWS